MRRLRHVSRRLSALAAIGVVASVIAGVTGCSAGLGTVYPSQVQDAIHVAELSVGRARARDLSLAAQAALAAAEVKLAEAKQALADEDGLAAHAAAQQARVQAESAVSLDAQSDAYQQLIRDEAERHDANASALASARTEAENTRRAAETIQRELKALRDQLAGFRTSANDVVGQKQAAERRTRELGRDLSASRQSIRRMTELLEDAQADQIATQRQVASLAEKVQGAAVSMDEARRREREAEAEKQRARELAQAYTQSIQTAGRESARDQALAKARADARPAVPTISPDTVRRAGSTLKGWKDAWAGKDIARHLTYYLTGAEGERITIRGGQETRTRLTHTQLLSAIRASDPAGWDERVKRTTTYAVGSNVVAEIPYQRRVGSSALYEFWIRKAFWDRRGSDWRIVREEWRYYDEVPQFTDR